MQGENDAFLNWPFDGKIVLAVLDYSNNNPKKHIVDKIQSSPDLQTFKRPSACSSDKSFGFTKFVLLTAITKRVHENTAEGIYLLNDILTIRAKIVTEDFMDRFIADGEEHNSEFVRNGSVDSSTFYAK